MEIITNFFLLIGIVIIILVFILMVLKRKKLKRNKNFRNYLIKALIISSLINFGTYAILNQFKLVETNDVEEKMPENVTSKGFKIEIIDGVTYIDGYLIANKTYSLPADYIPKETYKAITNDASSCEECIVVEAYDAYQQMKKDANSKDLTLWIASGYRSYNYQAGLYNSYVKRSGKEAADTYSARAGYSEHQTGYAFDLNTVSDEFANTKEGIWIDENCAKYGFIIRYPKGKEDITGYKYESWHLRYVGVDLALKLYNAGDWITMEEYFGITSKYSE